MGSGRHNPSQLERLRLIAGIASRMHEGQDLDDLLQGTADAIHDVLGFPNVDIPLLDPNDPEVLVVRIRGGHYKDVIRQVDRIPLGRGIMGSAVRARRTMLVNDVRADPRYVCPPGVQPALAELAVPIHMGDEVFGVVNVESDRPFDESDRLSVEAVADFLGIALRNRTLLEAASGAAVLTERQRLARELHDNVTQILSSISLLTQTLDSAWRRDPAEGSRRVARLSQLAQTAFAEMRMLLRELSPPGAGGAKPPDVSRRTRTLAGLERLREHALPGALERMLAVMAPEDLLVRLECDGYVAQKLEHEEALYRVTQEALSNVIRHARARHVQVSAGLTQDQVVLRIADDGRGIDTEFRPGIGLSSMRTRLESSGGHLRVTPNTPNGTLIEARLPRADR
jgi:signal transduction histidine kinase